MDIRNQEAQRFQQSVRNAREDYISAKRRYQSALSTAVDTKFSSDGATGLRIASQEYRRSLERYNAAVNRWAEHLKAFDLNRKTGSTSHL
jgi:hypothetical protein